MEHHNRAPRTERRGLAFFLAALLLFPGVLLWAQGPPRLTREQGQMLQQAQQYAEQAGKALEQNRLPEAVAAWRKKLAIERRVFGSNSPYVAQSLQVLVRLYQDNDDFDKATATLDEVLALQSRRLGKDHWQVAQLRHELAGLRELARLSAGKRRQVGEAHRLNQQVLQLYGQGKASAALPLAQKVAALRKEALGEQHPDYARALSNLATLYKDLGDLTKAETFYEQARAITKTAQGTGSLDYAHCLNNLALLYQDLGENEKAETLLRQTLDIKKAVLGEKNPDYAQSLNNLAGLYWARGSYDKAEPLFQKALLISKQAYGENSPLYAAALGKLALVYQDVGNYRRAVPLLQSALAVRKQAQGEKNPEYADSLNALAWVYFHMADYDKAEPLFQKASLLTKEIMGDKHPDYAASLNTLAWLFEAEGGSAKAENLLEKASTIYKKSLGTKHPDYADNLSRLARVYAAGRHWNKAADAYDEARKSFNDHALRVLPALTEGEQLSFLREQIQVGMFQAVSLALARPTTYDLRVRSAGWHLNAKALAAPILAEGTLLARDNENASKARLIKELTKVRQQLANLTFAPLPPVPAKEKKEGEWPRERDPRRPWPERRPDSEPRGPSVPPAFTRRLEKISGLALRESSAARNLGRPALYPSWTDLTAVRRAMPGNAVLIDFGRVAVTDFTGRRSQGRWKPARYVAYLVPALGKGRIELIDLGEAEAIDTAVAEMRQAFLAAPAAIEKDGEAEAEQQVRRKLQALSRLLIQPMTKQLARYEHWIVSPDSSLWLVPWGALPVSDGRYALEKYQITYVASGRDLLHGPAPVSKGRGIGKPLVLADPDYSGGTKDSDRAQPRFTEVPSSASEAKALAPLLERYAGAAPEVATGKQARKNLLTGTRGPRAVVLSAQGFFREDQDEALPPLVLGHLGTNLKLTDPVLSKIDLTNRGKKVKVLENPLARCGLGLAGANRPPATSLQGPEDGLLTGQDVTAADLRGTELVLLTAGVPGGTSARIGDAVGTFRQAFQLAGARTVIDTLWPVPEPERVRLWAGFFDNLTPKISKSRALRQAQLAIIQERRAKGKAAHPLYWAGFTLTGSWK